MEHFVDEDWNIWSNSQPQSSHIICLQEMRQELRNTLSYNFINKLRDEESHGGGVCVGIASGLIFRDLSDKIPE